MSATKQTRKWAKTAGADELRKHVQELTDAAFEQKNPLVRSSLRARADICMRELDQRMMAQDAKHARDVINADR